MRNFLKITDVNVAPLMAELTSHPDLWDQRPERRITDGTPHSNMRDIWVRYNSMDHYGPKFNDEHVPVWYPAWNALPALKPIVHGLMALTEGEMLGGVLITKIPPGDSIDRHIDHGWHVQYYDKFYVTLQSAPGSNFWCEHEGQTEYLNPEDGEIWLFDNRKPHWVENHSDMDRITLIVCLRTEKYGRQ